MERRIIYFPEPTTLLVADRPIPETRVRDQELAALTAEIRRAEALAANFRN